MFNPLNEEWFADAPLMDTRGVIEEVASLNPEWTKDRLKKTAPSWFDAGMLKAICQEISKLLNGAGIRHKEIADKLGVSPAAVSQWFSGATVITSSKLTGLQHRFRQHLAPLYDGNVGRHKERAVSGYSEVMYGLRHLVMGDRRCDGPPTRQEFAILYSLMLSEEWYLGDKQVGAIEIVQSAKKEMDDLGLPLEVRQPVMESLKSVQKKWAKPYVYAIVLLDEALL